MSIIENAGLLLHYNISSWTANATDKGTSEEVARLHNSSRDECGRYVKRLLGKCEALEKINNFTQTARNRIKAATLPYDTAVRLMPISKLDEIIKLVNECRAEFDKLVDEFISVYPSLVERARTAQQSLFSEGQCPSVEQVRNLFAFSVRFETVPETNRFEQLLGDDINGRLKFIEEEFQERLESVQHSCEQDLLSRISKTINHSVEKLSAYSDDSRFMSVWVTKVRDLEELRSLNEVAQSHVVTTCLNQIQALSGTADSVKTDSSIRASFVSDLKYILSCINHGNLRPVTV